jgi:serine protease Do
VPIPVPGRAAEALRRSTAQIRSGNGYRRGNGSAVVLTDGQVITNAHVIQEGPLAVESWEGKTVSASVLKIDRGRDLALLSAQGLQAPSAQLGDSNELRAGTPVIAVGNPMGFVGAVSTGIVHAIGPAAPISRSLWIHADVRLAPGNSGGPLADLQGQIVGINTMIVAGGLALAIPSRAVQSFLTRTTSQRSLGVVVRPVSLKERGIGMMILELVPGGAAEAASLLPGDILVGSKEQRFRFLDDLQNTIDEAPGALLHLEFYRAGQEKLRQVVVQLLQGRLNKAA